MNDRSKFPRAFDGHDVKFYEEDKFLCDAVVEFLSAGMQAGQPLIAIVTTEHRGRISQLLSSSGFDIGAYPKVQWLDARMALDLFMTHDGMPDPERFTQQIGKLIEESRFGHEHLPLRVFGEMVDLLARDGNLEGAVSVEKLWNELGQKYGFALLCAYTKENFYREAQWKFFRQICDEHTVVEYENGPPKAEASDAVRKTG